MADDLFSPAGVVMMSVAVILDLAGLVNLLLDLIGLGLSFSFVLDIVGLIFIGGWMLFARGKLLVTKGLLKRVGASTLGELLPIFGDLAPCWTLGVYFELSSGSSGVSGGGGEEGEGEEEEEEEEEE